jgi:hypothetical protein
MEVALGGVVDDVLQRDRDVLAAKLDREGLVGIGRQAVEEGGIDRRRLVADQAGQGGALGAPCPWR